MLINDGGPAFPRPHSFNDPHQYSGFSFEPQDGMSLRDWFAEQALAGAFAELGESTPAVDVIAKAADAMLKAREK